MNMIFLGAPGAGKGTQAEIVSEKYSIPAVSTGAIIREAIKNQTEMGKAAREYTEKARSSRTRSSSGSSRTVSRRMTARTASSLTVSPAPFLRRQRLIRWA